MDLPVQDACRSFPRRTLRLQNRSYYTVYDDRRRIYVPGNRPPEVPKPRIRPSRLKIRAANNPTRNVIKVAREYEAFLARPEVYGYRQVAQNFSISKVMVSYYLTLLNRLPADFISWLENCEEELPLTFFSLKRLRPVTMLDEPDRRPELLVLTRKLIEEMQGEPSEAVPALLELLGESSLATPKPREHRSIQLD
ncbi:hypothetical protein KOR42_16960 [Thalassoglobus neptunius]|uniref:Uncharacterized protein n=1 Tax=Thalassoglobus neptunius TaxID=1938619 RepID=A0A5C5X8W8_9PLAN|nr:hypothetical protein [Thalassoglobus neptunius]TWT58322.1 hypothetical protein KOR42_16960 [Thalassoglobus neptunius]